MVEPDPDHAQSSEACPACGAFTLALIDFPEVHSTGYLPANEIMGMGERTENTPPAIGCLTCGTEWRDLATFQRARDGEPGLGVRAEDDAAETAATVEAAFEPGSEPTGPDAAGDDA